jgi:hypothetical protein
VISKLTRRIFVGRIGILVVVLVTIGQIEGQMQGVYPVGMSATNSGVTPRSGFTY